MVRPRETKTHDVTGASLEEVHQHLVDATPPGFVLASGPEKMSAGTTQLTATGTYISTVVQEVEADDMPTLRAKVPDGWMLLNVRRAGS